MTRRLACLLLALLLAACAAPLEPPPASLPPAEPTTSTSAAWYSVLFSDPSNRTNRGGPDAALAAAIDSARQSVDVAIYDLNLWSLRDALLAAHQRGVRVRVVVESDNRAREEIAQLEAAGVPVLGDRREGLMHHKFVIIDGYQVWTGSMNFTIGSAYRGDNNLLRIDSTRLAENYTHEFEEMFVHDLFGDASARADTPNPVITLDGTTIENYFSPDDGAEDRIVALIHEAQSSVYFMAFAYTSNPIGAAMLLAYERGVEVAGVMETGQASNSGSEYQPLLAAGINVRLDGNPADMHHKVIIIDRAIVITGSYNFSRAASETNDENLLILHNPQIAQLYLDELVRVLLVAGQ